MAGTTRKRLDPVSGSRFGEGPRLSKKAYEKAERFQALFYQSLLHRGKEVLDQAGSDQKVMVIVGRPTFL